MVKVEETYEKNKAIPGTTDIQLAVIKTEDKYAFQNHVDVNDEL